jgi:hypothetical protein
MRRLKAKGTPSKDCEGKYRFLPNICTKRWKISMIGRLGQCGAYEPGYIA